MASAHPHPPESEHRFPRHTQSPASVRRNACTARSRSRTRDFRRRAQFMRTSLGVGRSTAAARSCAPVPLSAGVIAARSAACRREHSMKSRQVNPWRRHQDCEAGDEVHGFEHDVRRSVAVRSLDQVASLPLRRKIEPLHRHRRATHVTGCAMCGRRWRRARRPHLAHRSRSDERVRGEVRALSAQGTGVPPRSTASAGRSSRNRAAPATVTAVCQTKSSRSEPELASVPRSASSVMPALP
jgi:hypothetical protein